MIANDRRLDRRAAIRVLLEKRDDLLLVTGLGSTTYDAASVGDDPRNFYLWGAMGAAALVGLGLAIAQPQRRVLVVTGDGEMLMGLGGLATIGIQRPPIWRSRCSTMAITAKPACSRAIPRLGSNWSASRVPAASRRFSTSVTNWGCVTLPAGSANRRRRCSLVSRSAPMNRRGSCRRATACC